MKPGRKRKLVDAVRSERQVSIRRACSALDKTRPIYRELGLQLRNKTPKRRVKAKLRDDRRPAKRSKETWAMDFVHDQLASGHKLRVLTIVNTFSRFSPALAPRFPETKKATIQGVLRSARLNRSN